MPIRFDYPFREINTKAEIIQLDCRGDTLLAWWYCGIYKNARDQSQPLVLVAFRVQISDKIFSDEIVYRYISIALLSQIRIGSLCRDNRLFAFKGVGKSDRLEKESGILENVSSYTDKN